MTRILYYGVLIPLSWLPLPVLYVLSDLFFLLVWHVIPYRRKIVFSNLQRSFPEKTPTEIRSLAREFYRHFCDLSIESVKAFSITDAEIRKRMRVRNPEILDPFYAARKTVILAGGHYGNWEWFAMAFRQQCSHHPIGLYKPLNNPFMDRKMRPARERFGLEMGPIQKTRAYFERGRLEPLVVIFGFDQSPGDPLKCHWMSFLGQDTGAAFGVEKYAKEYDAPVFYGVIHKIRRGYYEVDFRLAYESPATTQPTEITEGINRMLEKDIRAKPEHWLWSHKRWKHSRPPELRG